MRARRRGLHPGFHLRGSLGILRGGLCFVFVRREHQARPEEDAAKKTNRGELPITLHENSPPIVERGRIRPLDTRRGHSSRELPIWWVAWSERRCLSAQCVPQ